MPILSTSSSTSTLRCCRCNRTAKCARCFCVRSGSACLNCLPGDVDNCHNRHLTHGTAPNTTCLPSRPPERNCRMPTPSTSNTSRRTSCCCRCNGTAKCVRCICARLRTVCLNCLPDDAGNCHNRQLTHEISPTTTRPHQQSVSQQSDGQRPDSTALLSAVSTNLQPSLEASLPPSRSLPSISNIMTANIPTLRHVPKGARDRWARVLGECLSAVCDSPSEEARWLTLFMSAKCLLASPPSGRRLRWYEIFRLVKKRLARWLDGDLPALWTEAVAGGHTLGIRMNRFRPASLQSHNIRRAKQAVQDGQYSKAIKALSSAGLATPSDDILQEMLQKHPQADLPSLPPDPVPSPYSLSEAAVLKAVRSFPKGSASGPSGLRPSHLREAVGCPSPDCASYLLVALIRFTNILAAGSAQSSITPISV